MTKGWIKLHREIQDHRLLQGADKCAAYAFIDLILLANWETRYPQVCGKTVEIRRGSLVTSITYLAARWGWNRKTVSKFLRDMEADKMVDIQTDRFKTIITICNYEKYQGGDNESLDKQTDNDTVNDADNAGSTMRTTYKEEKNLLRTKRNTKREKSGKYTQFVENDFNWPERWGERPRRAMQVWIEYKAKLGKPCLLDSYQAQVRQFALNPEAFMGFVIRARRKGWQGLNEQVALTDQERQEARHDGNHRQPMPSPTPPVRRLNPEAPREDSPEEIRSIIGRSPFYEKEEHESENGPEGSSRAVA